MANVLEMKNIYKNMVKTYRSDRVKELSLRFSQVNLSQ